jgi:hypothetical protein
MLDGATVSRADHNISTARGMDLRLITRTTAGVAVLRAPSEAPASSEAGTLVVQLAGYLPTSLQEPTMPGSYPVMLHHGRRIEVAVTTMNGTPVSGARALIFTGNLDQGLREESASSNVDPLLFSTRAAPWYCSAACDDIGTVVITAPHQPFKVAAERHGWFLVRGPVAIPAASAAGNGEHKVQIVMEPILCAILPATAPRLLGRALITTPSGWTNATNVFAFGALDSAKADLHARHPGDLVVAECILPGDSGRTGHARMAPEVSVRVLLDGVGLADFQVRLLPFDEARVTEMPHSRATSELGELSVGTVPGYSVDWDPPLFAILMEPGSKTTPVTMDLRFGESYRLPAGGYRVFQRRLGPIGKTLLGDYFVTSESPCRVTVPGAVVRWPVQVTIRSSNGASPSFCHLVVRRAGTPSVHEEEWRISPRDPRRFLAFLDAGAHEFMVSDDGATWSSSIVQVAPHLNQVTLECEW